MALKVNVEYTDYNKTIGLATIEVSPTQRYEFTTGTVTTSTGTVDSFVLRSVDGVQQFELNVATSLDATDLLMLAQAIISQLS